MEVKTEVTKETKKLSGSSKDVYIGQINVPGSGSKIRPIYNTTKQGLKYKYTAYEFFGHNYYPAAEYDLYEIAQAEEVDGYLKRAIKIKSSNMFKSGWSLVGKNKDVVKYVKTRFLEMALATNYPMELLLRDLGRDFIRYNNTFLVTARSAKSSSGKTRRAFVNGSEKQLQPIAGYFRLPAETVRIKTDPDSKHSKIQKYLQVMPDGRKEEFNPENIVHFFYDRKAGNFFGSPTFWPALDDLRALRRIEENVEFLVHYFIFPFFAVYVGSDEHPPEEYADGRTEIDVVTGKINMMPTEGGLVLSYRHKIEVQGFDNVLPIEKYIEHFKGRIWAALGVSSIDMGESSSANRNTADSLTRQQIDDIKDYQQVFEEFVNFNIIYELLMESPWGINALIEDNVVKFKFNEIDIDTKIKVENHNALLYEMNSITEDEMRQNTNREPLSDEERKGLHLYKVSEPLAKMGAPTDATQNASAKTKQQPTNQHGKATGPTKKKSSISEEILGFLKEKPIDSDDFTKEELKNILCSIDIIKENPLITGQVIHLLEVFDFNVYSNDPELAASVLGKYIDSIINRHTTNKREKDEQK